MTQRTKNSGRRVQPALARFLEVARTLPSALILLFGLAQVGCSKRPGDQCPLDTSLCADDHAMLACNTGAFVAVPCKGPGGCHEISGTEAFCDFTPGPAGAPCSTKKDGKGFCSEDGHSEMICDNGKLLLQPCRGAGGCTEGDNGASCNTSAAREGDPCAKKAEDSYACEAEGKNQLVCRAGKYIVAKQCLRCEFKQRTAICHTDYMHDVLTPD
jgi:hypothetical protein